ncbi:MAG: DUF3341 domain-containing protein [Dehalococcoidia bacterium]|nr:DUF3341 domain-containing protein [Dehalococcoidia bacterium]
MAETKLLGLFEDPQGAADALSALREEGFPHEDIDIYSGSPFPEGTFGEYEAPHRLYMFPLVGAMVGFAVGLLLTAATQISYPIVTGGKPLLSIPPMTVIMYEMTMLHAIIFTVLGILFESRLPKRRLGVYDTRITEGYIGLIVACPQERSAAAETTMRRLGAEDVKQEA